MIRCSLTKRYKVSPPLGVTVPAENEPADANQRKAPKLHLLISSHFHPCINQMELTKKKSGNLKLGEPFSLQVIGSLLGVCSLRVGQDIDLCVSGQSS